jgi:hypothetical protein
MTVSIGTDVFLFMHLMLAMSIGKCCEQLMFIPLDSLMKMVYSFSERSNKKPTWYQLKHAILRNFGGLDKINPADVFDTCLQMDTNAEVSAYDIRY